MEMWDWVLVGNGNPIESAIVSARTPVTRLGFGNHMEGRSPRAAGWPNNACIQHVLEFVLGNSNSFGWKATWSGRAGWASRDDVVCDVVFNRGLLCGWSSNVRELAKDFRERC